MISSEHRFDRMVDAGADLAGIAQTRILVKVDDVPPDRIHAHPAWPLCRSLGAAGFSSIRLEGAVEYFEPLAQAMRDFSFMQIPGLWTCKQAAAAAPEADVLVDLSGQRESRRLSAWLCRARSMPLISVSCGKTWCSVRVHDDPFIERESGQGTFSDEDPPLLPLSRIAAGIVLQELLIAFGGIEQASPPAPEIYYDAANDRRTGRGKRVSWPEVRLQNVVIEVVGAGALGAHFLESFAPLLEAGSELRIFDHDVLEEINLPLQCVYNDCDLGRAKAEVISERLSASCYFSPIIRPFALRYEERPRDLSAPTLRVLCPDNFVVRQYANELSVRDGRPLAEAGTSPLVGQQRTYLPGVTACLEHRICGLREKASSEQQPASCAQLRALTLPGVNAILGGVLATEVLRALRPEAFGWPSRGTITYDARMPQRFGIVCERPPCVHGS